jgi:hypothetical protein
MASQFNVSVARRCETRAKALRGEVKNSFDRVVDELRQRGCEAGGIRMRAETGADHRVCERRFYRDWRMHLVFGDEHDIVISWVGRHTEDEDVHADGAEVIPGLSGVGRPRDRQTGVLRGSRRAAGRPRSGPTRQPDPSSASTSSAPMTSRADGKVARVAQAPGPPGLFPRYDPADGGGSTQTSITCCGGKVRRRPATWHPLVNGPIARGHLKRRRPRCARHFVRANLLRPSTRGAHQRDRDRQVCGAA